MNEKQKRITTCRLLDVTRQAYQRHRMITEHLDKHFDVDYDVFTTDPLFAYAVEILSNMITDHQLLFWWLDHKPEAYFYSKENSLEGEEIRTAQQLWKYYQESLRSEA